VLLLLIAGKTLLDLSLHLAERDRNAPSQAKEQPPMLPDVITMAAAESSSTRSASEQ
jgi:hypothetical protein